MPDMVEAGDRELGSNGPLGVDVDDPGEAGVRPAATERTTGSPPWWQALAVDAAVLVGLAAVAVTQPILGLLGDNPTFFVAGRYEPAQIVGLALAVAVVPPVVVFGATLLPVVLRRRLARPAHAVGVGVLAALFVFVLCRTMRIDGVVYVVPAALVGGATVAAAEWRSVLVRRFLAYLAMGNVAFVLLFLLASPVADLVRRPAAAAQEGVVTVPPLDGPVLVVVLDELPVTTLMRADGTINALRYPNFARLAESSTWFRNAAAESRETYQSTPSILSGRRAAVGDLPTVEEHPRNLLTLFGDRYPVNAYEMITDMLPRESGERRPRGSFRRLLDDTLVVYQHRVLPPAWHDGLPTIGAGWGGFGADAGLTVSGARAVREHLDERVADFSEAERSRSGQLQAVRRQVARIDARPSINFVHAILPHHPYVLTPWGDGEIPSTWLPDGVGRDATALPPADDPGYQFAFQQVYALQSLQIGALDRAIGDAIDHLQAVGAWDGALVVVTSDHGIDTTAPGFTRSPDDTNTDELFRVPLFIKAPGQREGRTDDSPASTVDILPSILDLLEIDADWQLEGHSLFDGSEPEIERRVTTDVEAAIRVAGAHAARYPRGDDWEALAAVGVAEELVGTDVSHHAVGPPSPMRWAAEHEDLLADLSIARGPVPYLLRGTVADADGRPPDLAVALNGTIAGAVGAYGQDGDRWLMSGVMAPYFVDGRNEVVAYEVRRAGGSVSLHPLA